MPRAVSIFVAATLAIAAGVCVLAPLIYPARVTVQETMDAIVPATLPDWQVQTLPIAETETLQDAVNKVLRYDSAVIRSYQRNGLRVTVYAAHWAPGKMSLSDVGAHTPDTCWVVAGWQRLHREHAAAISVGPRPLQPAELGTFRKDGAVEHVMFWHLAGGRPISFEQSGWDERWPARIKRGLSFASDLARFGLDQRCDQTFVRITSNRPFPDALGEARFRALLQTLEPLGIFAPPAS